MSNQYPGPHRPERPMPERSAPEERFPETHLDPEYSGNRVARRQLRRHRPWYSKGWIWLLFGVIAVVAVVWALSDIGEAVRATAAATREQTGAIVEQTNVLREQGRWVQSSLQDIQAGIAALVDRVGELIRAAERFISPNSQN